MYKTVEECRAAIEKLTTLPAALVQTECYTRVYSGDLMFTLMRREDWDTKETEGWFLSHVERA